MVKTRITNLPHRPSSVQTQESRHFRKAKGRRRKAQLKFILHLLNIFSPLLTTSLWLVTASGSSAQHLLGEMPAAPVHPISSSAPLPLIPRGGHARSPDGTEKLRKLAPEFPIAPQPQREPLAPSPRLLYSGTQISLNGRILPGAWSQWQLDGRGKVRTGISDAGVTQLLGVELLNTRDAAKQPVQWFSQPTIKPLVLKRWLTPAYRYLDMTDFAQTALWQLCVKGDTLLITTPAARVEAVRLLQQPWGERIVVDLDRPAPWQITQQGMGNTSAWLRRAVPSRELAWSPLGIRGRGGDRERGRGGEGEMGREEWVITIDAAAEPALIQQFGTTLAPYGQPVVPHLPLTPSPHLPISPSPHLPISPSPHLPISPLVTPKIETNQFQTILRVDVPTGLSPRVATLSNPNRLVIDLRPDSMVERDILWAPGLRWRQQFLNIGASRFPVVWLEINLRASGLTLKPIWSDPTTLVGIAPLLQTAQRYAAAAAINGGFFNRNQHLPLGAIRRDGRWFSSPILNRGAIAWNDVGQVKIGRLSLQETLTTSRGEHLPILALNSGYVQAGASRYSSEWGSTYTPLSDNEIIVVVQNNLVTAHLPGGIAGITAFPIPPDGYLLALRDNSVAALSLPVGTLVSSSLATVPADLVRYPQILGAGPLLVQNRQIVLNAKAEHFSDAFIRETAPRSAIGITEAGTLLIAAVHNRAGGAGPTLAEIALLMQQLGCIDALNLDGGSSTSLYLGGQLLNRSPRTAARVHNGLGVFLHPGLYR